jgi:GAF domain-containing protein
MIDEMPATERVRTAVALAEVALDPRSDTLRLDDLVLMACAAAGADSARLLMLTDQAVTANIQGPLADAILRGQEEPLEDSIGVNALRTAEPLVIPDAAHDDRVSSVPAVASGVVGSYLGAPLRTKKGEIVGVLCALDSHVRIWTPEQVEELSRIADLVIEELGRLEAQQAS